MDQVLEKHSMSEVKENLSGLITEVETSGGSFVISRYGKPIAVVSSYDQSNKIVPKLKGSLHAYANTSLIEHEKMPGKRQCVSNEGFT